jgi:chorismate-pyruvate lyase
VKLDVASLAELFYPSVESLGDFAEVEPATMPEVYRRLLAHEYHMTVTVEAHHGCPIDVAVLEAHAGETEYARKILLTRSSDGRVVQFGIVRIHWQYMSADVRRGIESQATPLGRILIDHDVMRRIHVSSLYRVTPSNELAGIMRMAEPSVTYGRTAMIYCDDHPAIELLEIVAAEDE